MREVYGGHMEAHPLKREIIATQITNDMANRMGGTFWLRMQDASGHHPADIARAYTAAREIFAARALWQAIEALDNRVSSDTQIDMFSETRRLLDRATLWLLRQHRTPLDIAAMLTRYIGPTTTLAERLHRLTKGEERRSLHAHARRWQAEGVDKDLALRVAGLEPLYAALDLSEVSAAPDTDIGRAAALRSLSTPCSHGSAGRLAGRLAHAHQVGDRIYGQDQIGRATHPRLAGTEPGRGGAYARAVRRRPRHRQGRARDVERGGAGNSRVCAGKYRFSGVDSRALSSLGAADKSEIRAGPTSGDPSMNAMAKLMTLAILSCTVGSAPLFAATYKWVDDKGAVHYSQTPPANRDYELLRKPPSIKEAPAAPAPESQAPTPAASPPAEDKEAREKACEAARTRH